MSSANCCLAQFLACAVPAVSWTPDSCHLAWVMTAVACGLAISFCAGALWVERRNVPVACLSLPCVAWFWNVDLLLFDSIPCFAIPVIRCTRDNWIFLDDSYE